jgi:large subunit ribosomal protein L21
MKLAVIETGGKQYTVKEGETITIEKLDGLTVGDSVDFESVLMIADGDAVTIGEPTIKGKKVTGTLREAGRGKKVHVSRFRSKSRYHRTLGHRQPFMAVEITKI